MKTMTNAMMRKCEQAIKEFNDKYPNQYVHGCGFHHYGDDYRIEENETEYKIFKCCKTSIEDTLIETIKKGKYMYWIHYGSSANYESKYNKEVKK